MNPSWIHQSTQGEKCDFHLASKSMTCVIDFGGTSLCRTESLIQSEIPFEKAMVLPWPVYIRAAATQVVIVSQSTGFPPVAREDAKILILGSMPGQRSLAEHRYYAHPQNSFWPIIYRLLNSEDTLDYGQKQQLLLDNHIALWDVLKKCERKGSLDADIDPRTIALNDFQSFFLRHREIKAVLFNGARAEQLFRKGALPALTRTAPAPDYHRLPSTSPAHAALGSEEKYSRWRVILDYL